MRRLLAIAVAALLLAACGDDATEPAEPAPSTPAAASTPEPAPTEEPDPTATAEPDLTDLPEELFPDVLAAEATEMQPGVWSFSVTLSSPYDTPQRYADAWRVLAPDGTELGVRILGHDHANEQPFTRSLTGVEIPEDVTTVTIEGRDQISGWGGATVDLELPR